MYVYVVLYLDANLCDTNCEYSPSTYLLRDFYVLFATVILKGTIARLVGLSRLTVNLSLGV